MRVVVRQGDACAVQPQGVARHRTADRTDNARTGGGGGAVVSLGERAADRGGGGQGFRGDGSRGIGNDRGGEAVVAGHTAVGGRTDGEGATARGGDPACRRDVGIVVGQADAGGVQAQGVAIDTTGHGA